MVVVTDEAAIRNRILVTGAGMVTGFIQCLAQML